ncbi:hypothetical protein [Pseudoalteromonas rubra]|uniref:hypothetical protein n=1 Tax=Pseudoalteromonas rubra TaxID=43658 RepID=UPI002DC00D5E|nr:hypothetical protein [Pseudoalteromonas rubra]MEC4091184.1 hypothetical protein [Pseudoalteromonas rubra]
MKYLFFLLIIGLASGCTTIHKNVQHVTNTNKPASDLLVYREPGFMAGAVDAMFGENNKYFMKLSNGEFARFKIDSGEHTFQVDVDGAPEFELKVLLTPGSMTCIKVESNPNLGGAVLIPLVANLTPNFIMSEVKCPTIEHLKDYQLVYGL